MDAVEFIKAYSRMCHYFDRLNGNCANPRDGCPLENVGNGCNMLDIADRADEAVAAVEQWAKEHPVKTRQSELLKIFPKCNVDEKGVLLICPVYVDPTRCREYTGGNYTSIFPTLCDKCRRDFWLQEIE